LHLAVEEPFRLQTSGPAALQGASPPVEPPGGQPLLYIFWARGLSSSFGRITPQRPFHTVGNAFRGRRLRGELALARVDRMVEILKSQWPGCICCIRHCRENFSEFVPPSSCAHCRSACALSPPAGNVLTPLRPPVCVCACMCVCMYICIQVCMSVCMY
jgi:hypothetical protein